MDDDKEMEEIGLIVETKDLLERLNKVFGENPTEEDTTLLEDISDTFQNFSAKNNEDWKKKYEENDSAWRKKYHERFFSHSEENEEEEIEIEKPRKRTYQYNELFKRGE